MSSNYVFQAKVVADEFALRIASIAIEVAKGDAMDTFFFESLELDNVLDEGMTRGYSGYFKSFTDRAKKVFFEITLRKNFRRTQGQTTELSNWCGFGARVIDENSHWVTNFWGKIEWNDAVPTISYNPNKWMEPTTFYLEETATAIEPCWRSLDSGVKEAVFCPDRKVGDRVMIFSHSVLAQAYVKLTDPDGSLHRRTCVANSCPVCGGEYDGTGTCPQDCITETAE